MAVEHTSDGWRLTLKSSGGARFLHGGFLAFWLCGWLVGEALVSWILITGAVALLTGKPPGPGQEPLEAGPAVMTGAFLLLWLTLWTVGGIAAASEMLRLLWGEDRITVLGGRLDVVWMRGPFHRARVFERDAIRRIATAGGEDRLVLETAAGSVELSRLGSRHERREGATALRVELGLSEALGQSPTVPQGWEEIITPEGERALVANRSTRRVQARVASAGAMLLGGLTLFVAREALQRWGLMIGAFVLLGFTAALAAGAVWLARGRHEWRIGSGRLTLRRRFGSGVRDLFEARHLVLDSSTDSDGDSSTFLCALAREPGPTGVSWRTYPARTSRIVTQSVNDRAVRDLAAWLSGQTGIPLIDRTTPEARAAQLTALRETLEKAGRVGRWAAGLIDRAKERMKKAG